MEIKYLTEAEYDLWDEFLLASPQSTIYGRTWYLNALQCDFKLLVVMDKETIHGGTIIAKNEVGLYMNPLLCKYLGVYFKNFEGNFYSIDTKQKKVCNLLLPELVKLKSYAYNFHPTILNHLPFFWKGFANKIQYTYIIPLKGRTFETVFGEAYSKFKTKVRYAEKNGYEIVEDIDFDVFYEMNEKTFRRQGSGSPFKKPFLKNYIDTLSKRNAFKSFGIQDAEGNLMSVAGVAYDAQSTYLMLNGIDKNLLQRGGNEKLLMECIKFAMKHSDNFDFEGSMIEPINNFYRDFGGVHTPYLKIYQNNTWNFLFEKAIGIYKKIKYNKK